MSNCSPCDRFARLVLGVETRRGLQSASPAVYFTLFKIEERGA